MRNKENFFFTDDASQSPAFRQALDATDKDDNTPLHLACLEQNTTAMDKLLELGADPNVVGKMGLRPLHLCAQPLCIDTPYCYFGSADKYKIDVGHQKALKAMAQLINYSADVNAVDIYGNSVLHLVAFADCSSSALDLLLGSINMDSNLRDRNGSTAGEVAAKQCHWETAVLLGALDFRSKIPQSDCGPGRSTINALGSYTNSVISCLENLSGNQSVSSADHLAGIGLLTGSGNSCAKVFVRQKVEEFCRNVVNEIGNLDQRFEGELICRGSSYEDTKMGNPDEFDYMVELVRFKQRVQDYSEVQQNAGFVELRIRDDKTSEFDEFCVGGKLCNQAILDRFKLLTWKAMCRVNHSVNGHIYFPYHDYLSKVFPSFSGQSRSNSMRQRSLSDVKLFWTCSEYKGMEISIDLNPVVSFNHWPPTFRKKNSLVTDPERIGFHVIPKPMNSLTQPESVFPWRISVSKMETKIFTEIPPSALKAYRLVKALREPPITPYILSSKKAKPSQKDEGYGYDKVTYKLNIDSKVIRREEATRPIDVDKFLRDRAWESENNNVHYKVDTSKEIQSFYLKHLFLDELGKLVSQTQQWPRELTTQEKVRTLIMLRWIDRSLTRFYNFTFI